MNVDIIKSELTRKNIKYTYVVSNENNKPVIVLKVFNDLNLHKVKSIFGMRTNSANFGGLVDVYLADMDRFKEKMTIKTIDKDTNIIALHWVNYQGISISNGIPYLHFINTKKPEDYGICELNSFYRRLL